MMCELPPRRDVRQPGWASELMAVIGRREQRLR
jgi:hypothetical protein